jgi:hypothetical protein
MKAEAIQTIGTLILIALFCGGMGMCRKWEYEECVKVGHSKKYCAAKVAGCFGGTSGRRPR